MREIKFRFWDINQKEIISHESINKDHAYRYITKKDYNHFILPMQYIGLNDEKEIEIYQDDILITRNGIRLVVWFGVGFALKCMITGSIDIEHGFIYESSEVIGNIHENPELLTQHKN